LHGAQLVKKINKHKKDVVHHNILLLTTGHKPLKTKGKQNLTRICH